MKIHLQVLLNGYKMQHSGVCVQLVCEFFSNAVAKLINLAEFLDRDVNAGFVIGLQKGGALQVIC
jgi:hypothetical protein